jgi:hypothetical protein
VRRGIVVVVDARAALARRGTGVGGELGRRRAAALMQVDVVDDGECAGTGGVADGAWIRRRRSQLLRGLRREIGGLR